MALVTIPLGACRNCCLGDCAFCGNFDTHCLLTGFPAPCDIFNGSGTVGPAIAGPALYAYDGPGTIADDCPGAAFYDGKFFCTSGGFVFATDGVTYSSGGFLRLFEGSVAGAIDCLITLGLGFGLGNTDLLAYYGTTIPAANICDAVAEINAFGVTVGPTALCIPINTIGCDTSSIQITVGP